MDRLYVQDSAGKIRSTSKCSLLEGDSKIDDPRFEKQTRSGCGASIYILGLCGLAQCSAIRITLKQLNTYRLY